MPLVLVGSALLSVSEVTLMAQAQQPPATGALLRDDTGLYPRVVRLEHQANASLNGRVLATVVVPPQGGQPGQSPIYESVDGGRTFSGEPVGVVRDPEGATGLCCHTLYELPQAAGDLPAGTLLWAGSFGLDVQPRQMSIRLWTSQDAGRTWTYRSNCANGEGGLWEPEFSIAANGDLVCHFSDETQQTQFSQTLEHVASSDGGKSWGVKQHTVASPDPTHRPGMSVVRRLPNGTYFMTYEICGFQESHCAVFSRTSRDGLDWGDPANLGRRIYSNEGRFFTHTPVIAWAPGPTKDGRLLLSGQILQENALIADNGTGRTLMVNLTNGEGPWLEFPAPFAVANVFDNYCPNYSSPMLSSPDGSSLLLIATAYDVLLCKPYYATGPIPSRFTVRHTTKGRELYQFEYAGRWRVSSAADIRKGQGEHFTDANAASVRFRFHGTGLRLFAVKAPERGIAGVSVDGGPEIKVDLYATKRSSAQAVFERSGLEPGAHTLTVRVTGTKHPQATAAFISVTHAEFR